MNVQFLSDEVPGGVALIVVVESRPLHGGVRFEGNTVYPDKKLDRAVEFAAGQPIDESAIRKARQEIMNLYHKRGYGAVAVDYEITAPNPRGYSQVVFRIDEKAPELLRRIQFVGNSSISAAQLKEVMKQKERGLQNLIGRGGRTDAESIAEDVRSIEDHYRDNGFFRARVVKVAKVPVDGKFNDLVFTIDEGRAHDVTGITIDGVNAFSAEKDLAPYLKSKSGKPFSGADLQDDIKMITDYYRSRGYIDARVVPVLESPKDK
jgi:outer membrane protein insertion porin family